MLVFVVVLYVGCLRSIWLLFSFATAGLRRGRTRSQLRHTKETLEVSCIMYTACEISGEKTKGTHSIALQIRHLISLMQVLGDGRLAAACRASDDPNVLVL
jgi:hypothetical protein